MSAGARRAVADRVLRERAWGQSEAGMREALYEIAAMAERAQQAPGVDFAARQLLMQIRATAVNVARAKGPRRG